MEGTRRRLPPLGALQAFEAAARHMSFTRAAEELRVTHGAISHQVRGLEASLGCALFRRLHRCIVLTEVGEVLFTKVRAAFDLLEMTTAQVVRTSTKRPLVVSCIATFSMRWLMPRLHQFKARYPDIDIHLCAPGSPIEFPRNDIDVAIRVGPSDWPEDMEGRAFLDEEFGPVCSPALAQRCPLVRPEDLHRYTLLHTETRKHAWHDWLRIAGVTGIDPAGGQRFETFYFLLQAAASGFGMAIGPHPLVAEDIATGRLVAPFGFVPNGLSMYVLYPKVRAADAQLMAFRDWLLETGCTPRSF
jgi:LysR family transcriptional regulator, glycine cleavage system transcriptional activator